MENLLPFDEINNLERYLEVNKNVTRDELTDSVLDILLIAFANGIEYTNNSIGSEVSPSVSDLQTALHKKYGGKTYEDRLVEHLNNNDIAGIIKVAETEAHRMFNDASYQTAILSGKELKKTWKTMEDNRVRETHDPLDGVTVGMNEKFYTSDGDSALYPSDFENASNNINCRCYLTFSN